MQSTGQTVVYYKTKKLLLYLIYLSFLYLFFLYPYDPITRSVDVNNVFISLLL